MDNIIYSASPIGAFSGGIFLILFLLGLGIFGAFWAIFRRREQRLTRLAMGFVSIVLLVAGIGLIMAMVLQWRAGARSAEVLVNNKRVVESNCDNGGVCTSYVIESTAGQKSYDFSVTKDAFGKIEVAACYRFTYYPQQSLLGRYLGERDYSDYYESASTITLIENIRCQ